MTSSSLRLAGESTTTPSVVNPHTYKVSPRDREPLVEFMLSALRRDGCRIIHAPDPGEAPYRITFETPQGERIGVIAYAFLANAKVTKNRPADEHRFQVKYGSKDGRLHRLWQDPYGLYVTLFLGIDPELGVFVGGDPVLHNPTRFFISIEFKRAHVDEILKCRWNAWERDRRMGDNSPIEVLVGGTAQSFLRFIRFEREALGEDQGHRQLIAERLVPPEATSLLAATPDVRPIAPPDHLHALAREFELSEAEVLDLIASARRLKMAVRGWVAEEHLVRRLSEVPGVSDCARLDEEGGPDVSLRFEGSRPITIECKNVLRKTTSAGLARIDFQRTRASKADPCSRYYRPDDFDVLAACLHAVTLRWEFSYAIPRRLDSYGPRCPGKLSNNVRVDERWSEEAAAVLRAAVAG